LPGQGFFKNYTGNGYDYINASEVSFNGGKYFEIFEGLR